MRTFGLNVEKPEDYTIGPIVDSKLKASINTRSRESAEDTLVLLIVHLKGNFGLD